jgi:N-methylhydantoinase A
MATRIGIDTGGTFTDVVRWSRGHLLVHKLPSTPEDPGRAVLAGIDAVRSKPGEAVDVVHGTTVALNAVLQGRLPRTVFVTNRGFVDLIEIGRQERTDLYALEPERPAPPVPRELRVEVACRRSEDGTAQMPLMRREVASVVRRVKALRPESIAIGLLHSPIYPKDEQTLARALRRALPGTHVTCSAELWPALGEYERFSAAILNAAVAPLVSNYTSRLQQALGRGELRLLRSSTGILPSAEALEFPARAMFSGPAGGVLATQRLCEALRLPRAAAFDMGGTSTDVCLVQPGRIDTDQGQIAGLPLPLPSVDVHTVGCGGGSIAYCDRGGALRVGPISAGAVPGPACYGVGTEPTVTDAHVALGHLGADTLLGGGFRIDPDRSVRAIERLAKKLGLTPRRTAGGILEIADVAMTRALMRITGERAVDPAGVPLVAYGGAGGLHAAALSAQLGMPAALVPIHPGAFSALGLALAGESVERVEAVLELWSPERERAWRQRADLLCRAAAQSLGTGKTTRTARFRLRYRGQGSGLLVEASRTDLATTFARLHRERFGFAAAAAPIELVQIVARAERPGHALPALQADRLPQRDRGAGKTTALAQRRRSPLGGKAIRFLRREDLPLGATIEGPCILEEATATTRLPPGWTAQVGTWALQLRASNG